MPGGITPTECRWCGHPVHAATGEHPCCAIWIGTWGNRTCVACSESRKLNRMYLERKKREAQEKAKRRRQTNAHTSRISSGTER